MHPEYGGINRKTNLLIYKFAKKCPAFYQSDGAFLSITFIVVYIGFKSLVFGCVLI